jgi:hypothetical protein
LVTSRPAVPNRPRPNNPNCGWQFWLIVVLAVAIWSLIGLGVWLVV